VYNGTNPFFGFIPLLTYVYFRNLTPALRAYSLDLFHELGKTTLETYLMQHHIWLTSDAKSLLVLIPGYPKINMLFVTVLYFCVSRRLYRLTLYLRGMFLPNDEQFCFRSTVAIIAVILVFYFVALSLTVMNLTNLTSIGVISIMCGICLYQFIMDTTWNSFRESAPPMTTGPESFLDAFMRTQHSIQSKYKSPSQNQNRDQPESLIARISPPIIGSMTLFIIGLAWHGAASRGAGKIITLPPQCEQYANTGRWIPIESCNSIDMGRARRDEGIATLNCYAHQNSSPLKVWGWNVTSPDSLCRFSHRDPIHVKKDLENRRIVFVGDSMTRNMYYALLRSMGVRTAYYDATVGKHSDIDFEFESDHIKLEFKWAPLAVDQHQFFKDVLHRSEYDAPDVIIAGGGAWDRLHVYATDEDQNSLKTTVKELVKEIRQAVDNKNIPVVWTIPTMIHTEALTHEEKRDHMKEEDMEEMRVLYNSLGMLTVTSFVLDGPAFTRDRVEESYDGVHYPPDVYDGGAQILINAFDWVLGPLMEDHAHDKKSPQPGKMANPYLGVMMLCFVFIGLMFFDGFVGFSYMAGLVGVVKGMMPGDMYEEAFTILHRQLRLPGIASAEGAKQTLDADRLFFQDDHPQDETLKDVDDEIASLLSGSPASGGLMVEQMGVTNSGPAMAVRVKDDD
jgi:hypothetical protein